MNRKIPSEDGSFLWSKLFFLWAGRYIKNANSIKEAKTPLVIPKKYSLEKIEGKYVTYWKEREFDFTKKRYFQSIYHTFSIEIIIYGFLLTLSMMLGYLTPVIFDKISDIIETSGMNQLNMIKSFLVFLLIQLGYALIQSHSTHLKWKLVTAVDFNAKNQIFNQLLDVGYSENEINQGKILNIYSSYTPKLKGVIGFIELVINTCALMLGIFVLFYILGKGGAVSGTLFILVLFLTSKLTFLQDRYDKRNYEQNEERLKVVSHLLRMIREIQLLNFERFFSKKVSNIRREQSETLKKRSGLQLIFGVYQMALIPCFTAISFVISGMVFHYPLKTGDILTTFLLFGILDQLVNQFFLSLNSVRMCLKALDYILPFLKKKDRTKLIEHEYNPCISLKDISLKGKTKSLFQQLNLEVLKEELVLINGSIGSGKSSFLQMIDKRFPPDNGEVQVIGKVSYISTDNWFLEGTIKENIVMGKMFDRKLYKTAIHLSCLEKDLKSLKNGEDTPIRECGSNLSGGQKIRLQLARAIYQESEILLVDRVLGSVDKEQRMEIIQNLLLGYWKDKIRLVVSTNPTILKNADRILQLEDGKLLEATVKNQGIEEVDFVDSMKETGYENVVKMNKTNHNREKFQVTETRRQGLLKRYLKNISFPGMGVVFLVLFFLAQVLDIILRLYSTRIGSFGNGIYRFSMIYGVLIVVTMIVNAIRLFIVYYGNVKAGVTYHKNLVDQVVHVDYSKVNFSFMARAKTVFSNDIRILDDNIADYFMNVFEAIVLMATTFAMIIYSSFISVFFTGIFIAVFYYGQKASKRVTTYVVKKCNQVNEPCVSFLCNAYQGKDNILKYKSEEYIKSKWKKRLERAYNFEYTRQSVNRYELLKIQIAAVFLLFLFLIISTITHMNSSVVMVVISYLLSMITKFEGILRNIRHGEIGLESLNRMEEMEDYKRASQNLLKNGFYVDENHKAIEVKNLSCHYGDGNYILKNCNFSIQKGEHILLQGESGVGKTTVFHCIEKLIPYEGDILVYGNNIKLFSDELIREKICIMTQNSLIFSGTIKENLDPYDKHTALEIETLLDLFQLQGYHSNTQCIDFSDGEKQILCLARAYLSQPLLLLIDEGLDHLDSRTRSKIGMIIQQLFKGCTIISISHLGNEMQYDGKVILQG